MSCLTVSISKHICSWHLFLLEKHMRQSPEGKIADSVQKVLLGAFFQMDGRTRCASDNVHSLRKRLVLGLGGAPNEELIPQLWICQELGKGAHEVICLLCQILGRLKNNGSGPANLQAWCQVASLVK